MTPDSHILIIESNYVERANIIRRFKDHQLKHKISFVNNSNEALVELYFYNKEIDTDYLPKIILLNYSEDTLGFFKKTKSDSRFKHIKIFMLTDENSKIDKEKLNEYRISGYVERTLDFKNFSSVTYLDTLDLYLQLLKIKVDNHQFKIK